MARRSATRSCSSRVLKPKFAILDETDSGLDVDALKIVSEGVNRAKESTGLGVLLITHYTRILRYIRPDFVTWSSRARSSKRAAPNWQTGWRTRDTTVSLDPAAPIEA